MGILKSLHLRNFRNYEEQVLVPKKGMNILLGENGQGKTNILESIYFLSLLRSFRTNSVSELKRFYRNEDSGKLATMSDFYIGGNVIEDDFEHTLTVDYGEKRQLRVDGMAVSRATEFLGYLTCIAFSPEDIELVTGAGLGRRKYLDIILSQLYPPYLLALQHYKKALKNRNAILKLGHSEANKRWIESFNGVLGQHAAVIHFFRQKFFKSLRGRLSELGGHFYESDEALTFDITTNTAETVEDFDSYDFKSLELSIVENFKNSLMKDFERKVSHVGPHRDDFHLKLNGKRLKNYGSRGQCRLASLLLEIAAAEIFFDNDQEREVIFLVDDVTGELDEKVERRFFELLSKGSQVFFATTYIPEMLNYSDPKVFKINNGKVV